MWFVFTVRTPLCVPGARTRYTDAAFSAVAPIATGAAGAAVTEVASSPLNVQFSFAAVRSHVKLPAAPAAASVTLSSFSSVAAAFAEKKLSLRTDAREWNSKVPLGSVEFAVPDTAAGAATTGI